MAGGSQRISSLLAAAISAAAGFLTWLLFALTTPSHEAWDAGAWWVAGLAFLAILSAVLGYLAPVRVWRWAVCIVAGECVAIAMIPRGGDFALFPLALIFILLPLALGFVMTAMIGAVFAHDQKWDPGILW